MQSKESLAQEYLKTLPRKSVFEGKKMVLGLIGLPGTGKSTVARKLAERTGLHIASNDIARRFLNDRGFPGARPAQEILEYINVQRTVFLYDKGISHIIDADLTSHVANARTRAQQHGFAFYLVKVTCPEPTVRARIRGRLAEATSESRADEQEYDKRVAFQAAHSSEKHDFIAVIDTSLDIDPQVEKLAGQLLTV